MMATAANAQRGFNLSDDTLMTDIVADDVEHKQKGFANTEMETLTVEWEILSVDVPEGWTYTMCDNFQCYSDLKIGEKKLSDAFGGTTPCPFECGANPNNVPGMGTIGLLVYEQGDTTKADTMFFVFDAVLSIGNPTAVNFNIYPNPAQNTLNITFGEKIDDNFQVRVFNLVGQEQRNIDLVQLNSTVSVDIRKLSVGTYLVQFVTPEGKTATQRFTKKI